MTTAVHRPSDGSGALRTLLALALTLCAALAPLHVYAAATAGPRVVVAHIKGSIDYGVVELVREAVDEAEKLNAVLVLTIDTPGGLLSAALEISSIITDSKVPVVGYVYPAGKTAWSAGTLILMSCHIAAMAPGTIIGSLQPIEYDPATNTYRPVNESKIINAIVKKLTTLAEMYGRNETAAELFVTENLNLNAEEALRYHVVEYVASSIEELLSMINGVTVKLLGGSHVVIDTSSPVIIEYSGSLRARIVHFLADPLINGLLASLAVLLIIFSIVTGHFVMLPVGIALLILSLVGAGFSANMASVALIVIGAAALAVELFVTPGFGVLGVTGIALIAIGIALMPFFTPGAIYSPEYMRTLFWTGVSAGAAMGVFMGIVVYKIIEVKRNPPALSLDMRGLRGKAVDPIEPGRPGFVLVDGEYWRARSDERIAPGEEVVVVGKEGPVLVVRRASPNHGRGGSSGRGDNS